MTVGSMVIDCGNGIIKKDPDAERDVCNEDLGTDENTEGNIHDQEDSTSGEFEAEENVGEDIRSDLDEQGNAISEETKKVTEANIKNDPDEELDLFSNSRKFPTKEFLRQFIRQKFVCHIRGKNNFFSEEELSEHLEECQKIKAVEGLYTVCCTMCKMQFGSFFKLRQHMKICDFLHHKLEKAKKQKKPMKIVVKAKQVQM